ncbi:hypothetical protein H5410_005733 [Solanum commersonii]|uniref:Uncharacterized protein n=1 Tax=Solanum commersonii TaxID=4109 RepID=A0A9J6A8A3_SOLCO|nr:hypothetical protein H5410_005733 [Solanum commersonii]
MNVYYLPIQGYQGKEHHYARPGYHGNHLTMQVQAIQERVWESKKIFLYEEVSIEILVWQVWKLRNKEVASVKAEADMRSRHLYIFPSAPTLA